MSNTELLKLEEEIADSKLAELHHFFLYLCEASDEQFQSDLTRRMAAEYVLQAVRDHIHGEVSELHNWIRSAMVFTRKGPIDEQRRATFRTGTGRTHRFVEAETEQPEPAR